MKKLFLGLIVILFLGCSGGGGNTDTTAPTITLLGANPQTIEVGSSYVELGASANDNLDGDITANIVINSSNVNTAIVGSYSVTYDVNDSSGNTATQVTRTVNVVDSDTVSHANIIDTSKDYQTFNLNGTEIKINYTLDLGTQAHDIYLVYTNKAPITSLPTSSTHLKIAPKQQNIYKHPSKNIIKHFEYNETLPRLVKAQTHNKIQNTNTKIQQSVLGDNNLFYLSTSSAGDSITASLKRQITDNGTTLNIWVDNNAYGDTDSDCPEIKCINNTMIDYLANNFLNSSTTNDIYDLVTNTYGDEWGNHSYSNLIDNTNTIDILLFDISNDNSINGGVLGYFYPKDNFKSSGSSSISGSNEKIMFYIDSNLLASTIDENGNDTGSWSTSGYWPQIMLSTLAHEFQHMISYYQKRILKGLTNTDTWFDEMMSEITEDLVAYSFNISGPRNVLSGDAGNSNNTGGRFPTFNANITDSLTGWKGDSIDYSTVMSFGSYLLRNYGGANLLHSIMASNYINEEAIVQATGNIKTFDELIQDWLASVVLSRYINPETKLIYNTNNWITSSYNGVTYKVGSINFFNYSPQPDFTLVHESEIYSSSIVKVADNINGTFTTTINKDTNTIVKVIVEKSNP